MDEGFFVILAVLVPPVLVLGTLAVATVVAQAARGVLSSSRLLTAARSGRGGAGAGREPGAGPVRFGQPGQIAVAFLGVAVFATSTRLVAGVAASMGMTWREFTNDLRLQLTLAGAAALGAWCWRWRYRTHWALALAGPGLILERWLIGARFAALYDRARMEGLYQVTLEANRGLRQQAVLRDDPGVGPATAAQPAGQR